VGEFYVNRQTIPVCGGKVAKGTFAKFSGEFACLFSKCFPVMYLLLKTVIVEIIQLEDFSMRTDTGELT